MQRVQIGRVIYGEEQIALVDGLIIFDRQLDHRPFDHGRDADEIRENFRVIRSRILSVVLQDENAGDNRRHDYSGTKDFAKQGLLSGGLGGLRIHAHLPPKKTSQSVKQKNAAMAG